ncbi:MAG: response regulator, partial [Planctomycetota bacterium]
MESIGIVLNTIEANMRTEELLKQSQSMAEELQSQQEELQQTNEELEEKARLLSEQKTEVERKNQEVEQARLALEEKAEQLALTSKYKSEFLSNMSHELRTPLNSLLILSQQLAENPSKNLTPQQMEFAGTINSSGNDLLSLINDILDLSKIESGTVTLDMADVPLAGVRDDVERNFRHVAEAKHLDFEILAGAGLPAAIYTDGKRLQQVLKNLLSNAFKFTNKGRVTLTMAPAAGGWSFVNESLNRAKQVIAFSVADTGIGIPVEKQRIVFEAFQQADGTTARRYGGTGLGLAISREIAVMLGGEITLVSTPDKGSTFTFYLPAHGTPPERVLRGTRPGPDPVAGPWNTAQPAPPELRPIPAPPTREPRGGEKTVHQTEVADDMGSLSPGDRVLLIVEDDAKFAKTLLAMAREKGFKGVVTLRGEPAISLARQIQPEAITLDINLPDVDGWTVLDRLKSNIQTRHIPVHIITVEEERLRGLQHGAIEYILKPASKASITKALGKITEYRGRPKRLLVVEDDETERKNVIGLLGDGDIEITAVSTGEKALETLRSGHFDCMVLDLALPGISGFDVLREISTEQEMADMPVIIYTGASLTPDETKRLEKYARSVIVKDVHSPERLLDETALFLHRMTSSLPDEKRKMLEKLYQPETALAGKKILIVDDDVRNIFAITSLLERYKTEVFTAENGKAAIETLKKEPGIQAVLMDVMMPEMDGYDATRAIRSLPDFKT